MLQVTLVASPDRDSGEWETPEQFAIELNSVQIVKLFRVLGSGASLRASLFGQIEVEIWAWRVAVSGTVLYYLELQQNYTTRIAHLSVYTAKGVAVSQEQLSTLRMQLLQLLNGTSGGGVTETPETIFQRKYQRGSMLQPRVNATIQLKNAKQMNALLRVLGNADANTQKGLVWNLQHIETKTTFCLTATPRKKDFLLFYGCKSESMLSVFVSDVAALLEVETVKTGGLIERESSEERSELLYVLDTESDAAKKAIIIHQGKTCFVSDDSHQNLFVALFGKPLLSQKLCERYYDLNCGVSLKAGEWVSLLSRITLPPHEYLPRSQWFTFKKPSGEQANAFALPIYHSFCHIFEGEKSLALYVMLSVCLAGRNLSSVLLEAEGKWYPAGRHEAVAQRAWGCVYYYPPGLYEQLPQELKDECLTFWGNREPHPLSDTRKRSMWQAEIYTLMSMSSISV